ncbi:accessory gene regulator B family protein [Enterococcus faecalis]|nr:accessory gene regulator B family protein [Enterococcus faecalis]NSN09621.1 accessory gene regulator B family protein [Enterococcus faecalis]NSU70580.1 accessory gene regulator B family protein [Enterococcus faecalis]
MTIDFITKFLFDVDKEDVSLEAQWTRYYVRVIVSNVSKTFEVFVASLFLGVLPLTLYTYISFYFIRRTALGWHASSNVYCSLQSVFFFSIVPFLVKGTDIPFVVKLCSIFVFVIVMIKYAPQCTGVHENLNTQLRMQMKKKSIAKAFLFSVGLLFLSSDVSLAILIAMVIQTVMLLPITKKIVIGKENKNEQD